MTTVSHSIAVAQPTVHYARIGSLDGYRVETPCGPRFVDHDGHVYALDADQAHALTDLGAVPAVERANVLQALAQVGEVAHG